MPKVVSKIDFIIHKQINCPIKNPITGKKKKIPVRNHREILQEMAAKIDFPIVVLLIPAIFAPTQIKKPAIKAANTATPARVPKKVINMPMCIMSVIDNNRF